jgi:hypothetical protein
VPLKVTGQVEHLAAQLRSAAQSAIARRRYRVDGPSTRRKLVQELVLYLDIDADGTDEAELTRVLGELEDVSAVDVELEDTERSTAVDLINSFTVVITASAGTVGASTLLLNRVRALLESVQGVRKAWVQTKAGPKPIDQAIDQATADQGPE